MIFVPPNPNELIVHWNHVYGVRQIDHAIKHTHICGPAVLIKCFKKEKYRSQNALDKLLIE